MATKKKVTTKEPEAEARSAKAVKLVPMVRGDETADVHPDEVENWTPYGWSVKE